jgi:hypothetical protein
MDKIRIDAGITRLQINDGQDFLEFNPSDVNFAERFYKMVRGFKLKLVEYQIRAKAQDDNKSVDEDGIQVNISDGLALIREMCEYLCAQVDELFGKGTSQKVFGDALSLSMFEQFFDQVGPYVQKIRGSKIGKYVPNFSKPVKHKVMQ